MVVSPAPLRAHRPLVGGLLALTLRCVGAGACALACARRAGRQGGAGHDCPAPCSVVALSARCVRAGRERGLGVLTGW